MRSGYCLRRTDDLETVDSKLEEEEAEMQEEQARFASYSTFCEGAEADKITKIAENTQAIGELAGETEGLQLGIEQLGADIDKADADIAGLGKKIAALDNMMKEIGGMEETIIEELKNELTVQ